MIPYQNLYIYEISRAISDSKNFFKEDFIGCWNEGETSFLFFSQPHDEEVEVIYRKEGSPSCLKKCTGLQGLAGR